MKFTLGDAVPPACKFRVGKEYKTRDGLRAEVLAIYPNQDRNNIIGAVLYDGDWHAASWYLTGHTFDEDESGRDLMPSKTKVYLNVWRSPLYGLASSIFNTEAEARLHVESQVIKFVAKVVPIELEE